MSLTQQLAEMRNAAVENIPSDIYEVMAGATAELKAKALERFAPKVGEVFPNFSLKDQLGREVTLNEMTESGAVVITFYRGGWCPYCNMELKAYQNVLAEIQAKGASLVAISPELPDASLSTTEKNELDFKVLSDVNADFAKSLGIVFSLPEALRPIYSSFGIEVENHNGEGQFDLPLAATFAVDKSGTVIFADVTADYTHRADPKDVLDVL